LPVPVSPSDEHRHVRGGDAAGRREQSLHFLGEEDRVALVLDRVGRPQRGPAALFLACPLERQRVATETEDVAQQDRLDGVVGDFADECDRCFARVAKNYRTFSLVRRNSSRRSFNAR
jgi:hypothetical protein